MVEVGRLDVLLDGVLTIQLEVQTTVKSTAKIIIRKQKLSTVCTIGNSVQAVYDKNIKHAMHKHMKTYTVTVAPFRTHSAKNKKHEKVNFKAQRTPNP